MLSNNLNELYVRALIDDRHREARAARQRLAAFANREEDPGGAGRARRAGASRAARDVGKPGIIRRGARPAIGFLRRLLVTDR